LVAKANDDMHESNISSTNNPSSSNGNNANANTNNPASILPEDIFSSLIEIPILRPRRPRRRRSIYFLIKIIEKQKALKFFGLLI